MTKQKRLEASLYKGLRHMREVIYKALVVKDPGREESTERRREELRTPLPGCIVFTEERDVICWRQQMTPLFLTVHRTAYFGLRGGYGII